MEQFYDVEVGGFDPAEVSRAGDVVGVGASIAERPPVKRDDGLGVGGSKPADSDRFGCAPDHSYGRA
jgi:hypothetical protein